MYETKCMVKIIICFICESFVFSYGKEISVLDACYLIYCLGARYVLLSESLWPVLCSEASKELAGGNSRLSTSMCLRAFAELGDWSKSSDCIFQSSSHTSSMPLGTQGSVLHHSFLGRWFGHLWCWAWVTLSYFSSPVHLRGIVQSC